MEKKEDLTNNQTDNTNSEEENRVIEDDGIENAESLKNQLTEAYSKHESLHSKYLRTFADLENLKKRSIRDREEAIKRSRLQIIEDLLPAIDAFKIGMEEALKVDPEGPVVNGFKMAIDQMQSTLAEYGLVCIEGTDEIFDPNLHEAIGHEIGEKDDVILKVIRKGYRIKDYLIRPATVIISKMSVNEPTS